MEITRWHRARRFRAGDGRDLSWVTTALAAGVALVMLLAPSGSGVLVRPSTTLTAPYLHTSSASGKGTQVYGCAKATAPRPIWNHLVGRIAEFNNASSKACGKSVGVGGSSQGYAQTDLSAAIRFSISSPGSHSVTASVTLKMSTWDTFTRGGCPAKNVPYPAKPNQYAYGICEAAVYLSWSTSAYVVDENNISWYGNTSFAYSQNDSYYENYSDCYNFGSPACTNISGTFWGTSGSGTFSTNMGGFGSFTTNGTTSLTMWSNGTQMVRNHHYVLIVSVGMSVTVFANDYNLLGFWPGNAVGTINMGTLGNGMTFNSVTIS
ncbi:MAG: hypothetical protein L3K19_06650 [Thermoplasmata archaeon]|nr:hypothetical protein [Thermoplasmata archaeon]